MFPKEHFFYNNYFTRFVLCAFTNSKNLLKLFKKMRIVCNKLIISSPNNYQIRKSNDFYKNNFYFPWAKKQYQVLTAKKDLNPYESTALPLMPSQKTLPTKSKTSYKYHDDKESYSNYFIKNSLVN